MKIAVCQLNPTVGDLQGNTQRIVDAFHQATTAGAQVAVTPELALVGYPPRDLLDRRDFLQASRRALQSLIDQIQGPTTLVVGAPVSPAGDPLMASERIANGAVVIRDGAVVGCHRKLLLPTYDVFDEARYFVPGTEATVLTLAGVPVGLSICEDAWNDKDYWPRPRYDRDPVAEQVAAGAELLINISASPYDKDKPAERLAMLRAAAERHGRSLLQVNQVGGNDSLLFDGRSLAFDADGTPRGAGLPFGETNRVVAWRDGAFTDGADVSLDPATWPADVIEALSMGIGDYLRKCGFERVVLGLSGGIDSALTAALAVRALGPERVQGVTMPSRYSSEGAAGDAIDLAKRLGIAVDTLSIEPMFAAFLDTLEAPFAGRAADVTEENIQARIRGTLLMAYSNKFGALLLTTGNKSELAVGYSTLYGDLCGGLAVISDLYKTEVYDVARYLNAHEGAPIPDSSITKPPSAELRPDQTDAQSLPPYDVLDPILRGYIDHQKGSDALIAAGHDPATVRRILGMVDRAEYKRWQMPPGLRVSRKAFGEGRRLPIAQRFLGPMLFD